MEKYIIRAPEIVRQIDAALSANERAKEIQAVEEPSEIDRMSSAGRCWRDRWATFRGIPMDEGKGFAGKPKLLRVFAQGHAIEEIVVDFLENAGFCVGYQQLECVGGDGRWVGHIDGLIWKDDLGKKSLLEIKSSNARRYAELIEVGYEKWSPNYAAQLQAYMHTMPKEHEVDDALVAVYNKDSGEMYCERILYDLDFAMKLEKQSLLVTSSDPMPPPKPKAAKSRACKFCKWCDRSEWCWSPITDMDLSL